LIKNKLALLAKKFIILLLLETAIILKQTGLKELQKRFETIAIFYKNRLPGRENYQAI